MFGFPKYDTLDLDYRVSNIGANKYYEQRMAPRNDKVDIGEVIQNSENHDMSEYIRKFPRANNPAQGMGQAGSLYLNQELKQPSGIGKGIIATDPFSQPPGGWHYQMEGRLPMDYYSQEPRPLTSVSFPTETPYADINHPIHPSQIALTSKKIVTTVVPSAVYTKTDRVEKGVKPSITYKPYSAMEGVVAPTEETTATRVRTIKYIRDRDLITLITPVAKTTLSDGEITVPLKLKDPMAVAMAAAAHSILELPFQGKTIRLKDYTWTVKQSAPTAVVELVIESKTKLKDKYDLQVTVNPSAVSNVEKYDHQELALLENKMPEVSMADVPISNTVEYLAYTDPTYGIKNRYHYSAPQTTWNLPGDDVIPGVSHLFESKRKIAIGADPVMTNPYGPPVLYG